MLLYLQFQNSRLKNPKFWVFLSRCEKAEVKVIKAAPVATPNKKTDNTTMGKLNAVTNKNKPIIRTIKAPNQEIFIAYLAIKKLPIKLDIMVPKVLINGNEEEIVIETENLS